ncbi:hypothetical protein DICPUDRAFT_149147 [Dictyostelium purpureum]|uniref:RING-type domain-containing protein n=1 Tax=Dictyostelium purpureum TaxID=5786 RepID=F0ZCZ2_DICPU|nr:uncharacterized protein DICPUDRAFT_149147 [Dictyostelium purpureum]EGC38152.1 hypothetical protein DICPUDRAFT_149147 [Dictyostelium purpureum]|eukprot:XP_003285279.1 hypothetical protein DICPUDRAFT_149147 [Dictyostelium purpureum]
MLESILFAIFIWSLIILKIIFRSTPQETQTNNFTQTNNHTHTNNQTHINNETQTNNNTHTSNHKINETTNSTPIDQSPKEKIKYDSTSTFHYSAYRNIYCCSEYHNSQENSGRSSVAQEILSHSPTQFLEKHHAPKEPSQPENVFPYSPFDSTRERMDKEKLEKENLEILKREQQKEKEYMEQLKRENQERERIEKLEKERKEREHKESLERQRLIKERLEKEIIEAKEKKRIEREKKEKEKKEREQKKREEIERKQKEREEIERKQREREELERIQIVYKETLERIMERVRLENLERQEREEREKEQQREQHEREEREKQEREQQQREQQEREEAECRENEDPCTICIERIEPSQLAVIDCNHMFCYDCIMEMSYRRNNTCPNCRAPFYLVRRVNGSTNEANIEQGDQSPPNLNNDDANSNESNIDLELFDQIDIE